MFVEKGQQLRTDETFFTLRSEILGCKLGSH